MTAHVRDVPREDLLAEAGRLVADGWRVALAAAHEAPEQFRVVYVLLKSGEPPIELWVRVARGDAWLPTLAGLSYVAGRFEREMRDLYGIHPEGHPLPARLVRHGHWPTGYYPMRRDADPAPVFAPDVGSYPFVEVQGAGVYEIPVGPIHAGLIEPGHFRFSVVGETILQMKARLWFLHRGVEKLFEGRPVADGIALAERISGDTAVGHSVAYAAAAEQALGIGVSTAALHRRALLLELERLYNHVADLGAIVNDVGFGIVHAHAQRLRELLLRHNEHVTGHRLLRGAVSIGDTTLRGDPDVALVADVARQAGDLVEFALGNHGVADRLTGTAVLGIEAARTMGVLGYVARASGVPTDARIDHPFVDLGRIGGLVGPAERTTGDVLARFLVRAHEVRESAALVAVLAEALALTGGGAVEPSGPSPARGHGLGVVEAWRGTLCHRVEVSGVGVLERVKVVDPSFFNWPALPIALADTIVPDFPLANKSFNLSYAGNDL